jgi:hypothetical protein
MALETPRARASAGWAEVLSTLENILDRWLAHAVELAPAGHGAQIDLTRLMQSFEERLGRLQVYLDRAEDGVRSADAALAAEIEALGRWQEMLGAARRTLAGRGAGEV